MTITRKIWNKYIAKLRAINDKAVDEMYSWLRANGTADADAMIDYAYALALKYGEASGALAAEMYDAAVELSGMFYPAALPAEPATIGEVAKAVVGTAKTGNPEIIAGAVGRLVKMAGVDTTMQNAIRDGAEWAWIPVGDTCAFCITLASRGWQKASRKALKDGHAEHVHANCDCTYAIRFDGKSNVQGYDPEEYRSIYYGADLDGDVPTPHNRINAMRREIYAENREQIRAQQASAYEKRKELESSAAEEANV